MSLNENDLVDNGEINYIQFNKTPICVLSQKARQILSQKLNQIKIIPSDDGFPRDWRGIADLAGLRQIYGSTIQGHSDPMEKLLAIWCMKGNNETASFDNLIKFLVKIDRWDVLSDINEILVEDAQIHKENIENKDKKKLSSVVNIEQDSDENVLTVDDVYNFQQNLPPQKYDAFVLFDESDEDFAAEMINKMESLGFKLCFKERDLIGGISFEHEAVMRLISERCNRLIVIYSPEFLKSSANTYLVNYAQGLGIEKGQRKILPCLFKYCTLPTTLSCIWNLDYNRLIKYGIFWDKLRASIPQTSQIGSVQMIQNSTNQTKPIDKTNSVNILLNSHQINKSKMIPTQATNNLNGSNEDLESFVQVNLNEIPKSYNEEVADNKGGYVIDENHSISNCSSSKKITKKWNLKKWFHKIGKTSKEKQTTDGLNGKEKSKKRFKRQKLTSFYFAIIFNFMAK